MYAASISLIRKTAASQRPDESAALLDLLWAHATEDDRLEHIRIRAGPAGVDIVLFLGAASEEASEESAARLLARAHERSSWFSEKYVITVSGQGSESE